ncbi:A/G-specific adenine glycosylase [Microscilla marina]|uniref:Adenine DNA glycosylase n=1 Tax=Microscilla marina ATCC 23134 TaxID=313606 RepID=A1ZRR3_MICM2|nr:A/G-specific adenine glycosylase [Microscilla marina]EAY26968.1 A/G-specific adenine glycosylase [Microscilla marina ATCC 23134]
MDKHLFANSILNWYAKNKRDLPWRHTKDPYKIWLSEIILQQTRVKQGLPYYQKFVETYPLVQDLASADEQNVLRLWQGLGYYSRARNLHTAAKFVHHERGGVFPESYQELLKMKGVGDYTASAIASFAYNEKVAVVDGNVFRVLARVFGIDTDIASHKGAKEFGALAKSLLPDEHTDAYNQGIMEFGALQCTPQKPDCMYCPLQTHCVAYAQGKQKELPVKIKKIKVKHRYFHYLLFFYKNNGQTFVAMKQRGSQDIWGGLYDFWLEEQPKLLSAIDLLDVINLPQAQLKKMVIGKESVIYKHILTHQRIQAKFHHIEVKPAQKDLPMFDKLRFYEVNEVAALPKPVLIDNYLNKDFF